MKKNYDDLKFEKIDDGLFENFEDDKMGHLQKMSCRGGKGNSVYCSSTWLGIDDDNFSVMDDRRRC